MTGCELLSGCLFFNDKMKNMSRVAETMKKLYCLWNFKQCARYRVASVISKKKFPKTYSQVTRLEQRLLLRNIITCHIEK